MHVVGGYAEQRVDGLLDRLIDEGTRGPEAGERVEFGWHSGIEAKQDVAKWVQVDLGVPQPIEEIVIAGCHDSFNNIGAGFGFPRGRRRSLLRGCGGVRASWPCADRARFAARPGSGPPKRVTHRRRPGTLRR